MQGLKCNLAGNTIDPISLLVKRIHIAHVHERHRHPERVLPDDGPQYTHRTPRRTIWRVCSCLPDLVQKRPATGIVVSVLHGR